MTDSAIRASAWSRYWQQDVLHSLPGSYHRNYDGAIGQYWRSIFSPLGAGSCVLDIGTGNGALPALILETHPAQTPIVDALDLSDINPRWAKESIAPNLDRIRFHPRTRAEQSGLPADSYDLVVSQYGFEYTDTLTVVGEISRLLKAGGGIALVMHHHDSHLYKVAAEERMHLGWLLDESSPLHFLKRISPYLSLASTVEGRTTLSTMPDAAAAKRDFNHSLSSLASRIEQSPFPDVLLEAQQYVGRQLDAIRAGMSIASTTSSLKMLRHSLHESFLRCNELCQHAMTEEKLTDLCQQLSTAMLRVDESSPIHHENGLMMGWTLRATLMS